MISAIGSAGDAEHDDEPPGVELAVEVGDHRRQRDDHHDLGELRRLQLERPELEPGLRALALAAEPGDHHQQEQQRPRRSAIGASSR